MINITINNYGVQNIAYGMGTESSPEKIGMMKELSQQYKKMNPLEQLTATYDANKDSIKPYMGNQVTTFSPLEAFERNRGVLNPNSYK